METNGRTHSWKIFPICLHSFQIQILDKWLKCKFFFDKNLPIQLSNPSYDAVRNHSIGRYHVSPLKVFVERLLLRKLLAIYTFLYCDMYHIAFSVVSHCNLKTLNGRVSAIHFTFWHELIDVATLVVDNQLTKRLLLSRILIKLPPQVSNSYLFSTSSIFVSNCMLYLCCTQHFKRSAT